LKDKGLLEKEDNVCLAIPGKIIALDKKKQAATVDYGGGTKRKANVSLVQVNIGDYVLVHAGFAIQVLDEKEALETLALFKEMLSLEGER
jgi:hydrogenase expression/formation protein HypC